ncbi:MAG: VWA domain-containing protein, partial [Ruminococcaceae bacterium]|nr:VWA domain-containing protein [Oscillospiraceae bacterium]
MKKRIISLLVTLTMLMSFAVNIRVSAATYTLPQATGQKILDTITSEYSQELSDAIKDLMYNSDYSDIVSDGTTMRNYYSNGNSKSWPASNADDYISSVVDRGETVDWGWGSAGCMSYACFFSYSVYGTMGKKDDEKVYLDKNDSQTWDNLKNYIARKVQPGEHLRSSDQPHSVIYLCDAVENNQQGFYIAEYWGGAKKNENKQYVFNADSDQYYVRFYTYEGFAKAYSGKSWAVYNAYENSSYASQTPVDPDVPDTTVKTRDIVLVLDVSGSMGGSKLNNTKTASKMFVDQILDNSHSTKIALVTYDTSVRTVMELTDDKDALKSAIDALYDRGVTNMCGGLEVAGEILEAGSADKKAIVVMTDGAANEGTTGTSGYRTVAEGDQVWFDAYDVAIYDLAQEYINNRDYTIYSLGFGLSQSSDAYALMRYIASFNKAGERYFWSVTNANIDDIIFTYEDIADSIVTKKSIIISIECPVEVAVSYNGETLDKNNQQTSFGSVTVSDVADGNSYLFSVEDNRDYDISITGTGDGTMAFKISYLEGDSEEFREFKNVPITPNTQIDTSATDRNADFALYVDEDGDGTIDEGWSATENETVLASSDEVMEELFPTPSDSDEQVASVTASLVGGVYRGVQNVVLTADPADAAIYYTLDGSTPSTSSALYTGAIRISASAVLKAIAVKTGYTDSDVLTETYTIRTNRGGTDGLPSCNVKFETNGGSSISNKSVRRGVAVEEPSEPTKEGYEFKGWYTDK